MINGDDLTRMRADALALRGDNPVSVVIRRGGASLAAQTVRVARAGLGTGMRRDSAGAEQAVVRVIVMGDTSFDVQPRDRFTAGGILYEVTAVRPNRTAAVVAEAEAVE